MKKNLIPDSELPEATQELLRALDDVTSNTSQREPIHLFAAAFAKYLRTPD